MPGNARPDQARVSVLEVSISAAVVCRQAHRVREVAGAFRRNQEMHKFAHQRVSVNSEVAGRHDVVKHGAIVCEVFGIDEGGCAIDATPCYLQRDSGKPSAGGVAW